ncbi:MAG: albXV [Clostridia bacterium]|jgi:carbamoyltransferase|nr:albXV [Clostridia bacterium]
MKKRYYIGFANSVHDSAWAIVNDKGEVVFAEATERYLQNKRSINVSPDHFVLTRKLLSKYAPDAEEFVIAKSWSDNMKDTVEKGIENMLSQEKTFNKYKSMIPYETRYDFYYGKFMSYSQKHMLEDCGRSFEYELATLPQLNAEVVKFKGWDHHLTHAASGCFTSDFEDALCVIVDGYGERNATAVYQYNSKGNGLEERLVPDPELTNACTGSLGMFYSLVCRICGFDPLKGEEWKVMGLACHGKLNKDLYIAMKQYIRVENSGIVSPEGEEMLEAASRLYQYCKRKDQTTLDMADAAYTGQYVFEEVLFEFLELCCKKHPNKNLVIGGGCALNSSANGKIISNTSFEKLHIFAAPSDDGNAVGAALLSYYEEHVESKPSRKRLLPYLGSSFSAQTLKYTEQFAIPGTVTYVGDEAPYIAARCLAEHQIIGWAGGRAEFGPRALGNRSILANPDNANVKDIINSRVKFREEFRPFAPSILAEYAEEYFEDFQESPYMERTLVFKEDKRKLVPGVVHFDGTGRLQTVYREWNRQYYELIKAFYELTNIPLVLNTSFNIMGKPIIHSVEDAIGVFYTTGLDAMFIDGYYFRKKVGL